MNANSIPPPWQVGWGVAEKNWSMCNITIQESKYSIADWVLNNPIVHIVIPQMTIYLQIDISIKET